IKNTKPDGGDDTAAELGARSAEALLRDRDGPPRPGRRKPRRARAHLLAGPRPATARSRTASPDELARRAAVLRRVQRDGDRGPARGEGARRAAQRRGRP